MLLSFSLFFIINYIINKMIKKMKQIFELRNVKSKKKKEETQQSDAKQNQQKLLFLRINQSKKKSQYQKLNINLIFNKSQYKSIKDNKDELQKRKKLITQLLSQQVINHDKLINLAWNGIQSQRNIAWKILLGYLSNNIPNHYKQRNQHLVLYKQQLANHNINQCKRQHIIKIDIPRTFSDIKIFDSQWVKRLLKNILSLWDINGRGGYLQGMSDIAAIIFIVLVKYDQSESLQYFESLSEEEKQLLQSDLYWLCTIVFTKFFTFYAISQQKNLEAIMNRIENIIARSDKYLYQHFQNNGVVMLQFAFRWIYVLLSRQLPLKLVFRLLDSYFSSSEDFDKLHSFVVASLVLRFSFNLLSLKSFNQIIKLLQCLPTSEWTKKDIQMLVEESIVLMNIFEN